MNTINTTKLKQLMDDAGFLPDGDLLEFGEIVLRECIKVIDPIGDLTSLREEHGRNIAIQLLREHFDINVEKKSGLTVKELIERNGQN